MDNTLTYLFVYGSLRKGFQHAAHKYISDYFIFITKASVKGKLYKLEYYPAAVKTNEEIFIKGELYQLKSEENFSRAFWQLDEYEDTNPVDGGIPLFIREIAEVFFADTSIKSWIYWFNRSVSNGQQVLSGDILIS